MTAPALRARAWIAALAVVVLLSGTCGRSSVPRPSETASGSEAPGRTKPPAAPRLDDVCPGAPPASGFIFPAADGTSLYGVVMGRGPVGIVMANDVPHPLCEEIAESAFLARHGFRVLVFDYRGHGESDAGSDPGRLDLDVAGAAAELRRLGSDRVVLVGFYAGGAVALVASTRIEPAVAGVVAVSAAARRGQFVNGPYTAPGAFDVAPRARVPVLFLAVRTDRYVPLSEVRRLYRLTGSAHKRLVVFPYGGGGLDLFGLSSFGDRANDLILRFVRAQAA